VLSFEGHNAGFPLALENNIHGHHRHIASPHASPLIFNPSPTLVSSTSQGEFMNTNRRTFVLHVIAAGTAAGTTNAFAAEEKKVSTVKLTEEDKYAKSMGFRYDTTKVDKAKYPRHDAATQNCSKCQLYSGKEGEEWGPCSFFGGRLVQPTGWCRNFKVKKAAA
jgi:hypothetical protein